MSDSKDTEKHRLVDIHCSTCGQYLCSTYAQSRVFCEKCKKWTDGTKADKGEWHIRRHLMLQIT